MKTKLLTFLIVIIFLISNLPINGTAEKAIDIALKTPLLKSKNSSNLVAHYKFDGDLKDSSSYGNDGKVAEGNIKFVKGKFGEAAKFDGKSYITVKHNDSLNLDEKFTISVWLYRDEIYNWAPVLAKGLFDYYNLDYNNLEIPYMLYYYNFDTPALWISYGETMESQIFERYDLKKDSKLLYMLTVTIDITREKIKFYINGELIPDPKDKSDFPVTFLARKPITNDKDLLIGFGQVDTQVLAYFNGYMDDLRIYNTVLSDGEIKGLYLGEDGEVKEYKSINITPNKMAIIKEKGILNINVTGINLDGKKEDITKKAIYKSSDEKVFTVDKEGKVVAIGKGTATLTITMGKLMKKLNLTVK